MKTIKLHDKTFELFISEDEIMQIVEAMAIEINNSGITNPVFIVVLNGACLFAADLLRKIKIQNTEVSFIKLSSYEGTKSTGNVLEQMSLNRSVKNRNVIILEDIIDTGNTLQKITEMIQQQHVESLRIATLLFKNEVYDKNIPIDFVGKSIPDQFVVGYGLDYDEIGRNLPHIYRLKTNA